MTTDYPTAFSEAQTRADPLTIANKLVLGTAQLGMAYGLTNTTGKPSTEAGLAILSRAYESGVRSLDTAVRYGDSHQLIGAFHRQSEDQFKIHTKVSDAPDDTNTFLTGVCHELGCHELDILYFHSLPALARTNECLLSQLNDDPRVNRLGVSVYTNADALAALRCPHIEVVQIPFNLLDNITHRKEVLSLAMQLRKAVCTRSCFLQGLLLVHSEELPHHLRGLRRELRTVETIARRSGHSVASVALAYPFQLKEISQVVVGVDSIEQLDANLESLRQDMSAAVYEQIDTIQVRELELLNPSKWGHP